MIDWQYFTAAIEAMLHGQSPYTVDGFYSPPWLLIILLPVYWLPNLGGMALPIIALVYASYKKRNPALIAVVGLSHPFVCLLTGNIDWLAMLGTLRIGYIPAILLSVKLQAAGLALLVYAHRDRWHYLIPLVLLVVGGYVIYRWPFAQRGELGRLQHAEHNISLFPYSLPVGLWGGWRAWRDRSLMWGCVASLAVAPYYTNYSLVPALFLIAARHKRVGVVLGVVSWYGVAA